jgi:hypothetical protein
LVFIRIKFRWNATVSEPYLTKNNYKATQPTRIINSVSKYSNMLSSKKKNSPTKPFPTATQRHNTPHNHAPKKAWLARADFGDVIVLTEVGKVLVKLRNPVTVWLVRSLSQAVWLKQDTNQAQLSIKTRERLKALWWGHVKSTNGQGQYMLPQKALWYMKYKNTEQALTYNSLLKRKKKLKDHNS